MSGTLKDSNKFMDAGNMLESPIIKRFYKARDFEYNEEDKGILSFSHPDYDFIIVHPDDIFNEICLLEAKTTQKYLTQYNVSDYVTDLYFSQWNFTLGVMLANEPDTFSEHGFLVMFSRGIDYFEVNFKFDKQHYEDCLAAVIEFKRRLDEKDPPSLLDADLGHVYSKGNGATLEATSEDFLVHEQLLSVNKAILAMEAEKDTLMAYFKRKLGEAETLIDPDTRTYLITWKTTVKGRMFKVYEKNK